MLATRLDDRELFISFFKDTPIGMNLIDSDGNLLKVNQSLCKMLGYSEEELMSLTMHQVTHPDDLEKNIELLYKAIYGELTSYRMEKRYIHRSGEIIWAVLNTTVVRDHQGNFDFLVSQIVDITEQKLGELELKKIQDLHQLISEHSQDAIIQLTSDGILTYVSPAICNQLGYEPEELIGSNPYQFWHPEDVDNWIKQGTKDSRKIVYRVRHKNGHYIWHESNSTKIRNHAGEIQHVIAVCRDITERKNMELKLQESEQRYKSLMTYSPVGVCAIDKYGRFVDANPAFENITGYSLLELTQMHYHEGLFPETIPIADSKVIAALRGEPIVVEKTYIKHKSGKRVDLNYTCSPIIVNGETIGIYAMVEDITERIKTEEWIRRSEKLSLVGELAAGIAHEIRNPLTSLRGFIQLFKSEDITGSKRLRHEVMLTEIDRINEIVSELLVLAKPSNETVQLGSIIEKLDHVIMLFEGQANLFNIEIHKDFDRHLPLIYCQDSLKQVFVNVLKNAIESMPKGGNVWIQAKCMADQVCIRIIDQGCGIPQDKLDKIGQPFFTTKKSGTGLGLMVCQRILQNHTGNMRIESEVGKGTKVEFILPIAPPRSITER